MARPALPVTVGGIDPNSHRIVIVETRRQAQTKPFVHEIELNGGSPEQNTAMAFDFMVDYCISTHERDGEYPRLFVEAPVVGRGGPGPTIAQAFVTGSILAGATQGGSKITLVNNQSWKKRVVGNGNVNKLFVNEWVEENWTELYKKAPIINDSRHPKELRGRGDQDIVDSGCINLFGWKHVTMVERMWRRRNG